MTGLPRICLVDQVIVGVIAAVRFLLHVTLEPFGKDRGEQDDLEDAHDVVKATKLGSTIKCQGNQ